MFTTCPLAACSSICSIVRLVIGKKPARLTAISALKSSSGVLGERLADVDAGVVDQRVDPPEARERLAHDPLCRLGLGDVALPRSQCRGPQTGPIDRAVATTAYPSSRYARRKTRTDALRGAGDDRDLRSACVGVRESCRRGRSRRSRAAACRRGHADEDALVQPLGAQGVVCQWVDEGSMILSCSVT